MTEPADGQIHFKKAGLEHQDVIFKWLEEPHMKEFWDNSQEHKDDILNFINQRKQHYFYGTTKYWIGYIHNQPFSFILSDQILPTEEDLSDLHRKHLSQTGHTIVIDFGIGDTAFLGRGLASSTLKAFTEFYKREVDPKTDTYFIDPNENNPRAYRVYEKAEFNMVGNYIMKGGAFEGEKARLMVKKLV